MAIDIGPGELYSLGCALAWATAVILFKKSGESLEPFALNLLKNVIGLVLMLATLAVLSPRWPAIPSGALLLTLVSGLLGIGLGDTLYLRALNALGAGRMGVAQTMYSPGVILLSAIFLSERLHLWQFAGVALVLIGIAVATWQAADGVDTKHLRAGVALAGIAVFAMAAGVVMVKPLLEHYDFFWIVMLRFVGGLLGMLPVIAWQRSGPALVNALRGVRHWPQIVAGSVIGEYLSMMLWLAGYKYTQASIAAVLNELAAVFIIVLAALVLKEQVTWRQVAGSALAVGGVMLVVLR